MICLLDLKYSYNDKGLQGDDLVCKILTDLRSIGFKAFVAGGYVRDKLLGKETKDIDIFVLQDYTRYWSTVLDMFGMKDRARVIGNYGDMCFREDVEVLIKVDNLNLDILHMKSETIEDVLINFDTSICQCYGVVEDGRLVYYVSEDFMDYINNNIVYKYTNIPTTDDHLKRVKAKIGVEFTDKVSESIELIKWEG